MKRIFRLLTIGIILALLVLPMVPVQAAIIKTITPVETSDLFYAKVPDGAIISGDYLYILSRDASRYIHKIKTSDYSDILSAVIDVSPTGIGSNSLVMAGGYLWTGDSDQNNSRIYKIDPADLTLEAGYPITLWRDRSPYWASAITADDDFVYVGGESISAGTVLLTYYTSTAQWTAMYGDTWKGESFTGGTKHINQVTLKGYRLGTITDLTCKIYAADGAYKPTGSELASGTYDASGVTTDTAGEEIVVSLGSGCDINVSTYYVIQLNIAGDASNCLYLSYKSASAGYGRYLSSTDAGVNWTVTTGSLYFKAQSTYAAGMPLAKIALSDGAITEALYATGSSHLHSLCQDGLYLYGATVAGTAYKILKSDLSVAAITSMGAQTHEDIWQDATYFYNSRSVLFRTKKSDLTVETLAVPDMVAEFDANAVLADGRIILGESSQARFYIVHSSFSYDYGLSYTKLETSSTNKILVDGDVIHVLAYGLTYSRLYKFNVSDVNDTPAPTPTPTPSSSYTGVDAVIGTIPMLLVMAYLSLLVASFAVAFKKGSGWIAGPLGLLLGSAIFFNFLGISLGTLDLVLGG